MVPVFGTASKIDGLQGLSGVQTFRVDSNVTDGILEQPHHRIEDDPTTALRRQYYAGESVRELGVLILVFLPLETVFQKPQFILQVSVTAVLVGFGLVLVGIGLQAEVDVEQREYLE